MTPRTLAQLATVTLIWGSTWLVIKTQLEVVPPSWSVAYRFAAAGLAMLGWCLLTGKTLRLTPRGHAFAALLALFQFAANFNFVYRSEQHVTSGLVAVAFALLIVPNAVLGWLFLGQRVTARFAVGSLIGIAGVALLFLHEGGGGPVGGNVVLGGVFVACAVMCASVSNVMQATGTGRAQPPEAVLVWGFLYGTLADIALAFTLSGPPVMQWTSGYVAGVLYLGAVASALAFLLYFDAIRSIGPAKAAFSGLLVPFIAMGFSTLFENYVWSPLAAAGC